MKYRGSDSDRDVESRATKDADHGWLRGERGQVVVLPQPGYVGNVLLHFIHYGLLIVPSGTLRNVLIHPVFWFITGRPNTTHRNFLAPRAMYLSLIHISEPTRRTPISYAVFCLK